MSQKDVVYSLRQECLYVRGVNSEQDAYAFPQVHRSISALFLLSRSDSYILLRWEITEYLVFVVL